MTYGSLPTMRADLLLLHAPAFFDFRDRSDIYFPYLSTSGDVPITPLYEYFPVGFKTLQRHLGERGHDVKIVNLSTVLLRYPRIDVSVLFRAMDAKLFGIDLHWMIHVQGSLEIARQLKVYHPDVPIIFGGISSTYYAEQLIRYPWVDMVMRGYDTHAPMESLLNALRHGGNLRSIPNLVWKDPAGVTTENQFSHTPDTYACGIDWSSIPQESKTQTLPILEVLSTQNAGCAYNCGWCGGSREAFRRVFKRHRAMARKPSAEVAYEFETMARIPNQDRYHFYSVGSYNETHEGMEAFLAHVAQSRFKSISYEQYHLTPDPVLRRMAAANPRTIITLSPESSDLRIATLSGRGVYTMAEMEDWIERALDIGIYEIDIWFFIGMPEQDERKVMDDVAYCHRLLRKFRGRRVMPYLCPMIPFLDPASTFFEHPEEHGYRVFFRTVEDHRIGMTRASLINRINYETRWLTRRDLVHVGYRAVRHLIEAKADTGYLPSGVAASVARKIDDALAFIDVVHAADEVSDPTARARALGELGDEIGRRNREIFFSGVSNQALPINREIGGRWFDELGWPAETLEALQGGGLFPGPAGARFETAGALMPSRRLLDDSP
jgi:clorobiocin biosynthesis protein CloN6